MERPTITDLVLGSNVELVAVATKAVSLDTMNNLRKPPLSLMLLLLLLPPLLLLFCCTGFRSSVLWVAGFAPVRPFDTAVRSTRTMIPNSDGGGVVAVYQPRQRHLSLRSPPPVVTQQRSSGRAASKFGWVGDSWNRAPVWDMNIISSGGNNNNYNNNYNNKTQQEINGASIDFNNSSSNETNHQSSIAQSHSSSSEKNETESKPNTQGKALDDSNKTTSRGSGFGSYFPFLHQPQSTASRMDLKSVALGKIWDIDNRGDNSKNGKKVNINGLTSSGTRKKKATKLLNKDANETITVADLEVLLAQLQQVPGSSGETPDRTKGVSAAGSTTADGSQTTRGAGTVPPSDTGSPATSSSSSTNVAFPQPSELSPREIRRGTCVAGGFLGMFLGITILPNLWLVGILFGVVYGIEITKDIVVGGDTGGEVAPTKPEPKNVVAAFLIACGTRLAKIYLKALDGGKALWFLYKTGQLSYEYYKTYEKLDQKFAIQNKVDAWNRVFVEGKRKFDAWERENEVGRKALAGLRTAWLVDEESRMRASGRSRYRLVQWSYDLRRIVGARARAALRWVRSLKDGEAGLAAFWRGLALELRSEGSLAARLGAVGAAVATVHIGGALFSLSAAFTTLLAVGVAVIWPSWASDLWARAGEIGRDLRSRGSSDKQQPFSTGNPWECLQRRYEEYSSDRVARSRRNRQAKNNKKRTSFFGGAAKRNRRTSKTPSVFGFRGTKNQRPQEVGTWPNFKRTR